MPNYYWLHFKTCSHGKPWPCVQPEGYMSCGENGWTIGTKDDDDQFYPYSVIGSDECYAESEFDKIVPLKESHP